MGASAALVESEFQPFEIHRLAGRLIVERELAPGDPYMLELAQNGVAAGDEIDERAQPVGDGLGHIALVGGCAVMELGRGGEEHRLIACGNRDGPIREQGQPHIQIEQLEAHRRHLADQKRGEMHHDLGAGGGEDRATGRIAHHDVGDDEPRAPAPVFNGGLGES